MNAGKYSLPKKAPKSLTAGKRDMQAITKLVNEYCGYFGGDPKTILSAKFMKILPLSTRPYEKLYSH